MSDSLRLFGSFGFALIAALVATPVAIRVAGRTNFFDRPIGYKGHARPTPYLGGAAVMFGFLLGVTAFAEQFRTVAPIALGAAVLWAVGTVDDRINVSPARRVVAESAAASLLWATGHGWELFGGGMFDLVLTNLWIIGLVNAFNLMDNMDGAAGSVASVSAAGAGALALVDDQIGLACAAFALCGACIGFLPYNLRSPARIFLGDGGSMPVGFVVAATVMAVARSGHLGAPALLAAAVLVALPILDTTLVIISRRRRGISILTGGRDHVTHRLRARLPSSRAVALVLAAVQAALCVAAIAAAQLGLPTLVGLFALLVVLGATAIGMLETGLSVARKQVTAGEAAPATASPAGTQTAEIASPAALILVAVIASGAGLSAFGGGLYDLSRWGPAALVLSALLIAVALQSRARLSRPALVAVGSLAFLWLWSLASATWAESVDSAFVEAARWLLYLILLALLVMVIRGRRAQQVALGAVTAGIVVVLGYMLVRMLAGEGSTLFLAGRLNGPLGYVNGQASLLLLAFWPLIAAAERARAPLARGVALGLAALVVGAVLLTQTRAIIPALGLSLLVMIALVPGRERRLWALAVLGGVLAIAAQPVLDVYRSVGPAATPSADVIAHAARSLVVAAIAVAVIWTLATTLASRAAGPGQARASRAGLAVVVVVTIGVGLAALGNPAERVRGELDAFVHLKSKGGGDSRFLSGGGNRYDYWRVAVKQLRDEPLHGVGAGNFDRTYFLERRTPEDVKQAHSIELQVLGELGLVGGLALAALVMTILVALGRVARLARRDHDLIWIAVAAGGLFVTWLAHASVDWLNLLPGVTAAALTAASVLLVAGARSTAASERREGLVRVGVALVLALAAVAVTGRLVLADHYEAQAAAAVPSNPAGALRSSARSLSLNSQSVDAHYTRAAAYARLGDYERSRGVLVQAVRLEPHNFVTWALIGDLAVRRGDIAAARRAYQRAAELNPRDTTLAGLAARPAAALGG